MNLWYEQEARKWTEALPLGNGRLGGMVFGKTDSEIISLNEDTLWSGYPRYLGPRGKSAVWKRIRELGERGQFADAQSLFEDELASPWSQSYLPLGDVHINFGHKNVDAYKRILNLDTALVSVSYHCNGVRYTREIFTSAPDRCMVIGIQADKRGFIDFTLNLDSQLRSSVSATKDGVLFLEGIAPSDVQPDYVIGHPNPVVYSDKDAEKGMRFTVMVLPLIERGQLNVTNNGISVMGADSVMLLINGETSFAGFDVQPYMSGKNEKKLCRSVLENAAKKSYEALREDHINDYNALYSRVAISFGENENTLLPTDKRLERFYNEQNDPALYALLFQFGRYLLIAGSRPGTQAANLQGIWNNTLRAPWSSNYTININTQMNYWPSLPCALEETQLPLIDLVKNVSVAGTISAREIYDAPGFTAHHNSDIWALSWPVGDHGRGVCSYAMWNLGSAWLCAHLFERYEYTLDRVFLEETAYPIMKESARYYTALLSEDEQGYMYLCPSTSPENSFILDGNYLAAARTTAGTMALLRELFTNCVTAAHILEIDHDFAHELNAIIPRLFPFQIGSKGQLLEWDREYEEAEPRHRHITHLYGLYPGNQITPEQTPELAAACRKTLETRSDHSTGWSLAWKVNLWARLRDGDHALAVLNNALRLVESNDITYSDGGGTYPNMFCACPPFQIDGNFGASAGIAEMLLQSRGDIIHILPALPAAWKKGLVRGLRARGRISADIFWNDDTVTAVLYSPVNRVARVRCGEGQIQEISIKANKSLCVHF